MIFTLMNVNEIICYPNKPSLQMWKSNTAHPIGTYVARDMTHSSQQPYIPSEKVSNLLVTSIASLSLSDK